jgi:hypothetical protein
MTSNKQTSWPVPLRERDIGLGNAVREYARDTEKSSDESAAYARVLERLAGRPRPVSLLIVGFGVGAAVTVLATMVVLHRGAKTPSHETVTVIPTPPPPATSTPNAARAPARTPPVPAIRLAASPSVLPAGKVELVGEALATVSDDAAASARRQAGHTEIVLAKGSIQLHVAPRAAGDDFAVSAAGYRFMVVGTAFSVSQNEARLALAVSEGSVAVWRGADRVTTVGAGGQWSVPLAPARARGVRNQGQPASERASLREPIRPAPSALAPSPLPVVSAAGASSSVAPMPLAPTTPHLVASPPPAAGEGRNCGALADRNPQEGMTCYQQQAGQGGLAGEAAQYAIARLWRDAFRDPSRAIAAFREQRARFPRGVLGIEADLSIIELLPRLDRHAEALAESERFLKEHAGGERRDEIHLLRGNIYREAMRDFGHAEREYAQGAEARGRAGDDNRFLRAVCLEALGRTQEARQAYEAYLSRPKTAHAQEAKKHLEHLRP